MCLRAVFFLLEASWAGPLVCGILVTAEFSHGGVIPAVAPLKKGPIYVTTTSH